MQAAQRVAGIVEIGDVTRPQQSVQQAHRSAELPFASPAEPARGDLPRGDVAGVGAELLVAHTEPPVAPAAATESAVASALALGPRDVSQRLLPSLSELQERAQQARAGVVFPTRVRDISQAAEVANGSRPFVNSQLAAIDRALRPMLPRGELARIEPQLLIAEAESLVASSTLTKPAEASVTLIELPLQVARQRESLPAVRALAAFAAQPSTRAPAAADRHSLSAVRALTAQARQRPAALAADAPARDRLPAVRALASLYE